MQDWLGLGSFARINTPSTLGGNWVWRMRQGAFTKKLAGEIRDITKLYARIPQEAESSKEKRGKRKNGKS